MVEFATRADPTDAGLRIRLADPEHDAVAVAAIYAPAVDGGIASFEGQAPSADEVAARMRRILDRTPWLVAEHDGRVIGYAYAGPHHDRAGYRWSVNISVYVDSDFQGRGIGRRLYDDLLGGLRRQGFVNAYAGIGAHAVSHMAHDQIQFAAASPEARAAREAFAQRRKRR